MEHCEQRLGYTEQKYEFNFHDVFTRFRNENFPFGYSCSANIYFPMSVMHRRRISLIRINISHPNEHHTKLYNTFR